MEKTPTIRAIKVANGQVLTTIQGTGGDALEMLAMLHRSVALIMLENGATPKQTMEVMQAAAAAGVKMAVEDGK